jgi:hypothetical protein
MTKGIKANFTVDRLSKREDNGHKAFSPRIPEMGPSDGRRNTSQYLTW